MDEIERLRQYAARSSPGDVSNIDVTADVMTSIRNQRRMAEPSATRTVFMAVAASWLVAIGIGYFAQQSLTDVQDPLNSLTSPFAVTLE